MPTQQSLYEILGIERNASATEIKKAYVKLAREFHPDKYHGADDKKTVNERFISIQEAYEILRDEKKRADYDANPRVYTQNPPSPTNNDYDAFYEFFNNIFRNAANETSAAETPKKPPKTPSTQKAQLLMEKITRAVMARNEQAVASLCEAYKEFEFTEEQLANNVTTLNWLLRDCAEYKVNKIALLLIGIGADVNQYGEILKFEYFGTVEYNLVSVKCYFADMLAYWDNIELLTLIDKDKIDWNIYIITNRLYVNMSNRMLNKVEFKRRNDMEKLSAFEFEINTRLRWLTLLCYRLSMHNNSALMQFILNKTPNIPCLLGCEPTTGDENYDTRVDDLDVMKKMNHILHTTATTRNTIKTFLQIMNSKSWLRVLQLKIQYPLDRLSLPLHFLNSNGRFEIELLAQSSGVLMFDAEQNRSILNSLDFQYRHQGKIVFSVIILGIISAIMFIPALNKLRLDNDRSPGNITQLSFGALFSIPAVSVLTAHAFLLAMRVASCFQLDVHGSISEATLRLYKNNLLQKLLEHNRNKDTAKPEKRAQVTFAYASLCGNDSDATAMEDTDLEAQSTKTPAVNSSSRPLASL